MPNEIAKDNIFRRLWSSDGAAFRDHMLRLPSESRYSRFGMAVSADFIERYAERSIALETVVYGFFADGELRAVGELRPVNPQRLLGIGGEMEAAFSVETQWRNQGVGTELMRLLVRAAEVRCCTTLYLSFLTGNAPMRKLALKFGAEIQSDTGESQARVRPQSPSPLSMWSEGLDDAHSFAIAALDLQQRNLASPPETRDGGAAARQSRGAVKNN